MSFVKRIATGFTFALAMFTLTTFVAAQDSTTTDKQSDKPMKERRWGRGDGEGGRRGMRDGGKRGMHGGKHGGFGMRGLRNLDLTDAQKEQVRTIMESAKTANQPLRDEMKTLMQKRRSGEELTETEKARLQEIRLQNKQSMEQTQNSILAILTAEQRQKLEQMKEDHQKRREEFRQRRQENKPTSLEKNDGR